MTSRAAWTEPYTWRERVSLKWEMKRYDLWRFRTEGLWRRIAWKLPHQLVLWCFIRVMGNVKMTGTKGPDDITYSEAYKAWEGTEG